jgi:hypothetical protein
MTMIFVFMTILLLKYQVKVSSLPNSFPNVNPTKPSLLNLNINSANDAYTGILHDSMSNTNILSNFFMNQIEKCNNIEAPSSSLPDLRTQLPMPTVHAWIGALASTMMGFNFLFGSTMSFLTAGNSDPIKHNALDLGLMHKVFGIASFGWFANGVMDQLAQTASYCLIDATTITPSLYKHPWLHQIPESCKIAYGMATMIITSAIAVAVAVSLGIQPVIGWSNKLIDDADEQLRGIQVIFEKQLKRISANLEGTGRNRLRYMLE